MTTPNFIFNFSILSVLYSTVIKSDTFRNIAKITFYKYIKKIELIREERKQEMKFLTSSEEGPSIDIFLKKHNIALVHV